MKDLPLAKQELQLFEAIEIETLNVCTRTCWFCKWGQLREPQPRHLMSWDIINKIIEDLARLDYSGRLSWFYINEPLSDPRIYDIIKKSREKIPRALLVLSTNGDLLDQEACNRLIDNGLDKLVVSMYDEPTRQKVKLLKVKPSRSGQLILLDRTAPWFEQRAVTNRAGTIALKSHCRHGERAKNKRGLTKSCTRPFKGMWVQANGDIGLCCEDMYGDVNIANVMDAPLEETWFNSPVYKNYREKLTSCDREGLKLCETCTFNGRSQPRRWPGNLNTCENCRETFPDGPNTPCPDCSNIRANVFIHIPKTGGKSINSVWGVTRFARVVPGIGHSTAQQVLSHLGRENFDSRFKFAIVRNPYSKLVSCYYYFSQISHCKFGMDMASKFPTFNSFVRNFEREKYEKQRQHFRRQIEFVTGSNGEPLLDYIGRFEQLNDSWDSIRKGIGIDDDLPHKNKSEHKPWQEYYDPKTQSIVYNAYRADFDYFGYSREIA